MDTSVCLLTATLSAMDEATFLLASRFSMSVMFSSTSPSAPASCTRMESSRSRILSLYEVCSWMSTCFCSSRSGRSLLTASARSWSSRPSCVTVKLTRVVSACTSGGKCGLVSLVWRKRRKRGSRSTSWSPSLTVGAALPRLMVWRATTGQRDWSMASARFSTTSGRPARIASSTTSMSEPSSTRTTRTPLSSSRFLIHVMPWSWGSIIRGHRAELVTIAPFSTDARSEGR
mmetsp:Transcript_17557/g.54679  ORF Transcript_17557/g.54679 Transcript_17557/m.54679 type:complete len:231 (+) Transcript_17557:2832-3524(+)